MSARIRHSLGVIFAAISAHALAGEPVDQALTEAAQTAVSRGELLYAYDQAAWHGTDDFRANYSSLMSETGGYVVTGTARDTNLVFFDKSKTKALYRASFIDNKLTLSGPATADKVALTSVEVQMIAARDKGLEAFKEARVGLCKDATPNLTALPPRTSSEPAIVYLMTPQMDLESFPLGGHYSVEVAADGAVSKVRKYMNSCLEMSNSPVPEGGAAAGFFVTHLLDPTPTEIHVFTSMASKSPIFVGTSETRTWAVEGNSIRLVPQ